MNSSAKSKSPKVVWIVLVTSLALNAVQGWIWVQARIGTTRAAFMDHQLDNAYALFVNAPDASFESGVHQLCWITSYKSETDTLIRDRWLKAAVHGAYTRTANQICVRLSGMTNEPFGTDISEWLEKYCQD